MAAKTFLDTSYLTGKNSCVLNEIYGMPFLGIILQVHNLIPILTKSTTRTYNFICK
jgi:hypothetical protein